MADSIIFNKEGNRSDSGKLSPRERHPMQKLGKVIYHIIYSSGVPVKGSLAHASAAGTSKCGVNFLCSGHFIAFNARGVRHRGYGGLSAGFIRGGAAVTHLLAMQQRLYNFIESSSASKAPL